MADRLPAPTPKTVSPQMQALIAAPLNPIWKQRPTTAEAWKALVEFCRGRRPRAAARFVRAPSGPVRADDGWWRARIYCYA